MKSPGWRKYFCNFIRVVVNLVILLNSMPRLAERLDRKKNESMSSSDLTYAERDLEVFNPEKTPSFSSLWLPQAFYQGLAKKSSVPWRQSNQHTNIATEQNTIKPIQFFFHFPRLLNPFQVQINTFGLSTYSYSWTPKSCSILTQTNTNK